MFSQAVDSIIVMAPPAIYLLTHPLKRLDSLHRLAGRTSPTSLLIFHISSHDRELVSERIPDA